MASSVTLTNTFASQTGPLQLSTLDTNYSQLATAVNTLSNFANYYVDTGSTNAIVITTSSPQIFSYVAGVTITVKVAASNTGATTVSVNGTSKNVLSSLGSNLTANQLLTNQVYNFTYDGTNFYLTGGYQLPVTTNTAGNVTIAAPGSGTSLTINNSTSALLNLNQTTSNVNAALSFTTSGSGYGVISSNTYLQLQSTLGVIIPSGGLSVGGVSGSAALTSTGVGSGSGGSFVSSSTSGSYAAQFQTNVGTGGNPSIQFTSASGSAGTAVSTGTGSVLCRNSTSAANVGWLAVVIDATVRYIPYWT